MVRCLLIAALLLGSEGGFGADKTASYSLQVHALAPNAGGQRAWGFRREKDQREWSFLLNEYLQAGKYPLVGGLYSWRFPICGRSCFWQVYTQVGGGITSVGPVMELMWGMNLLWTLRLDIASHFYVSRERLIVWSYPLWVGLSVSL